MIPQIQNIVHESFKGKYEGIGQAVAGTILFCGLIYGAASFWSKQEFGYWVLRDTPKVIQVEFEPGLLGYDTNRDGNLDRLVSQIAGYRPLVLLESKVPAESELFKRVNSIYRLGFSRDARIDKARNV